MTMNTKWRTRATLTVAAMLALGLYGWRRAAVSAPTAVQSTAQAVSAVPKQVVAQLEASAAESARQQLARLPNPSVNGAVGGFSQQEVREVLSSYREMRAVQGLFNQETLRKEQMARILKVPHGVEICARALTDPQFARAAFGDLQAEARYYGSQLLKEAALKGQQQPLLDSMQSVARRLSQAHPGAEVADRGGAADLYELIDAFVDVRGTNAVASGDRQLAAVMGYDPILSPGVKYIFRNTVFHRLDFELGRDDARAITAAIFD